MTIGTDNEPVDQHLVEWHPLLMLSAAGELEPADQARVMAHVVDCKLCAAALAREREVLTLLSAGHRREPDAAMLAGFRAGLDDALDREEEGGWLRRTLGLRLPLNRLAPGPAWSAAMLLIVGFCFGAFAPRLFRHPPVVFAPGNAPSTDVSASSSPAPPSPTQTSSGTNASSVAPFDIHSADVAGISVLPSDDQGLPRVQLQMKTQQPVMLEGTVDDDDVKDALLTVLAGGDRFCPDIRLDAVECLRGRSSDPAVRSALCRAARKDRNAAVRLKAIEALDGDGSQEAVRQTLLDALVGDQNPGVRIEAMNALRNMAENGQMHSDDHTIDVLRERMQKDPNTYIRLQSAAAIRDIGPRQKF
jgi:HEAT repeats